MRNKTAETRDIIKKVNERQGKNLMLFNMGGTTYGLYDSDATKIDGVRLAKGTLDYLQGYIYGAYGYNDRN